jgi:hypothetical protein
MVVNQRLFLLVLKRKETWTKTQSKLCCVYIQCLVAVESRSSHIRVAMTHHTEFRKFHLLWNFAG